MSAIVFYKKYLKYKNKYLKLKELDQCGGGKFGDLYIIPSAGVTYTTISRSDKQVSTNQHGDILYNGNIIYNNADRCHIITQRFYYNITDRSLYLNFTLVIHDNSDKIILKWNLNEGLGDLNESLTILFESDKDFNFANFTGRLKVLQIEIPENFKEMIKSD